MTIHDRGQDTIFALSSGQPPAAIAIVRISGPRAVESAEALCGSLPNERRAGLRTLIDPDDNLSTLDEALVIHFGAHRSVTGEPLVELHCHGGRAIVSAILDRLSHLPGMRAADAGEFTRRSLSHGKMDLNAVEGLSDLLQAETESQRRAALAMYGGAFSKRIEFFQQTMLHCAALVEAALDFSDEDDVDHTALSRASTILADVVADMRTECASPPAERLRDGIRLVIAGPVNAGKSTLLNRLAGWEAAIVTEIAGTTRDRIEVPVVMGGIAYLLTDTAGFRDDVIDRVERIGIERAQEAIDTADIVMWLGSLNDKPREDAIHVLTQIDRSGVDLNVPHDIAISAWTGAGMSELIELVTTRSSKLLAREQTYLLSQRQRAGLSDAVVAGEAALHQSDPLLISEYIREALEAFDRLTGRASTEDMLNSLFKGFCIGK